MSDRRVAIVTGSGRRRVGNAVALALAAKGYAIVVHFHKSADEANETLGQIRSLGSDGILVRADLSIESEVESLINQTLVRFGRIDVLVNAAALWISKPLEQVRASDVFQHFGVNTLGTFLCSQKAGLKMVTQPTGGSIIMLGDWAIERPYPNYSAYFPSKGAIPAMTRSLAVELGLRNPNVRVNCILPGPVMLPPEMPKSDRDAVIQSTLVKREGRPECVSQAVLFLIENDFVTGVCLPVDGGRMIFAGEDLEPLNNDMREGIERFNSAP